MDADGDFVISWTSEVSNVANGGNGAATEIFARQFEPVGIVPATSPGLWSTDMLNDSVAQTPIQGVRPVVTPIPYNSPACPRTSRCPATSTPSA